MSKASQRLPGHLQDPILRLRTQAIVLATCCVLVWLIPLISRIVMIVPGVQAPRGLIMVHALCVTLLGFVDSLVYNQTRGVFVACFRKAKDTLRLPSYIERWADKMPLRLIFETRISSQIDMIKKIVHKCTSSFLLPLKIWNMVKFSVYLWQYYWLFLRITLVKVLSIVYSMFVILGPVAPLGTSMVRHLKRLRHPEEMKELEYFVLPLILEVSIRSCLMN